MKTKNLVIGLILSPIIAVIVFIIFILLYAWGPVFILRLTPYDIEQRRVTFPQWINNDEICYLELVLHRDNTVFEQGKFILFIKNPIMDIYIYRQKAGYPETKKLIKHIARRHIQPTDSIEGSLDMNFGFRAYDNGKKLFLYYTYSDGNPYSYRYVILDADGRNMKETFTMIIPLDISQDGKKLYGVLRDTNEDKAENPIMELDIKANKLRKIADITEDKFEQSRKGAIKDLKLLSKDKLVFSYRGNYTLDAGDYIYLVDVSNGNIDFVDDFSSMDYGLTPYYPHLDGYTFNSYQGFTLSEDGTYLIAGNIGNYEKKSERWTKTKDFYKEYPIISPDGKKIAYIDILVKKGEYKSVLFAGRSLTITNLKDLLESKESDTAK